MKELPVVSESHDEVMMRSWWGHDVCLLCSWRHLLVCVVCRRRSWWTETLLCGGFMETPPSSSRWLTSSTTSLLSWWRRLLSLCCVSDNICFFYIKSEVQESVDVNISGEKLTNSQDAFWHEMSNQWLLTWCQLFSNSHMMLRMTQLKKLISQSADN